MAAACLNHPEGSSNQVEILSNPPRACEGYLPRIVIMGLSSQRHHPVQPGTRKVRSHSRSSYDCRKTLECHHCGAKQSCLFNLKQHERRHTGERPFQCQHCDKVFGRQWLLNRHCKSLHKDKIEELATDRRVGAPECSGDSPHGEYTQSAISPNENHAVVEHENFAPYLMIDPNLFGEQIVISSLK